MAKAKQLPSGNWHIQVFSHMTSDGKRKYKSFTASSKKEVEFLAAQFALNRNDFKEEKTKNITLTIAIDEYILMRSNLLSPATIRGYRTIQRNYAQILMNKKIKDITVDDIQRAINSEAKNVSPKTIKNAYGLVKSIIKEYRPQFNATPMLPPQQKYMPPTLSISDVTMLINGIKGDSMELPILLALCLGMRRSEIMALHWTDVDLRTNTLYIRRAMIPDEKNKFVEKQTTKTLSSTRTLNIPKYISELFSAAQNECKSEQVFSFHPGIPLKHLTKICDRLNLPHLRLHDMRHIFASIGVLLNIGDKYMMGLGGWSTDHVMKQRYQHTLLDGVSDAEKQMNDFFENILNK